MLRYLVINSVEIKTTFYEKENVHYAVSCEIDNMITTLTFVKAIDFEQLESFISAYDVELAQIQLRGLTPDGTRVSIFSRTSMGLKETEAYLLEQANVEGYSIIGITGAFAWVDSGNLQGVQSDAVTYLADTSNDGFFRGYTQKNSIERNNLENQPERLGFPPSMYWDLEDAELTK